jgi:hypothetical protein
VVVRFAGTSFVVVAVDNLSRSDSFDQIAQAVRIQAFRGLFADR